YHMDVVNRMLVALITDCVVATQYTSPPKGIKLIKKNNTASSSTATGRRDDSGCVGRRLVVVVIQPRRLKAQRRKKIEAVSAHTAPVRVRRQ
ncbi:MAG: hypothetical protein AAGK74_16485, partial [Chloroflexota bacterium]